MPLWEGGAGKASWRSWVIQYLKTFLNNSREKHRASASMPWVAPVQVGYSPGEVRARGVQHLLTGFFQETVHQLAAQRGKEMVVQEKIQTHTHTRENSKRSRSQNYPLVSVPSSPPYLGPKPSALLPCGPLFFWGQRSK